MIISVLHKPFQTSMDPSQWVPSKDRETMTSILRRDHGDFIKARLFPLRGRIRKPLVERLSASQLTEGQIVLYLRTKLHPSPTPIEFLTWMPNGDARVQECTREEIELLPPLS